MRPFEDVLITADYDRTLTGPDGTLPERNLEAIRYFMEQGGTFTVNTGRSPVTARGVMEQVPVNAPFLLMNGSVSCLDGVFADEKVIDLDPWTVLDKLAEAFPEVKLEVQGLYAHYIVDTSEEDVALYERKNWTLVPVESGDDVGVFLKFNVMPRQRKDLNLVLQDTQDAELYDRITAMIEDNWGDKLEVFRSGAQLLNVHAKGVSKLQAARELQAKLGKKILVCIGDAGNDIPMLSGADYAFCPADGQVAGQYETVCSSADGAVADVIYKKITEIVGVQP